MELKRWLDAVKSTQTLPLVLSSLPSTHPGWLTTAYPSSSGASYTFFSYNYETDEDCSSDSSKVVQAVNKGNFLKAFKIFF